MLIQFPKNFIWGTSTAAPQIETAFDHDWVGVKSKDGFTFGRTSDHEKRRTEDLQYICQLGNAYRMSLDWSRLQREPYGKFVPEVVSEYRSFLAKLKARNKYIMLVLHHFANPNWFVRAGSWDSEKSIGMFTDYARQIVDNFGDMADNWNTFNEPNVYLVNSRFIGNFPPFKKNIRAFWTAFNHMSRAHKLTAKILKDRYPDTPVGISHNCVAFEAANFMGRLPAYIADKVFMEAIPDRFLEGCDYWGMSYYARIPLAPFPVTEVDTPGKLAEWGRPHDKMWQYYPEGKNRYCATTTAINCLSSSPKAAFVPMIRRCASIASSNIWACCMNVSPKALICAATSTGQPSIILNGIWDPPTASA